ncbi:MAG: methyltransferase, partial [Actinomycetota bacterium]|nr:methyltransferase [Actinomycetota bacterium]
MSVAGAYRRLPSPLRRAAKSAVLRADAAVHRRLGRHLAVSAMGEAEDDVFLDELYQRALGRPIDPEGLRTFGAMLAAGESRVSVILEVARSDECVNRLLSDRFALPSLVELRPDRFPTEPTRDGAKLIPVYVAETAEDFDWIERGVLDHGYYEKPGIWSLGVDLDKQVMAECLAAFAPTLGLEMGCASGAVLQCLAAQGVVSEGVEISSMAIARAASEVRPRIHHGDVLDLDLAPDYDLVFGLDIFEHLNPNRLDTYLSRLRDLLVPGGFLFANVPAYGTD